LDPLVERINELYKKQKAGTLTDEEKNEQAKLRREYVERVKGNLTQTLENTVVVNEDGTKRKLKKKTSRRVH